MEAFDFFLGILERLSQIYLCFFSKRISSFRHCILVTMDHDIGLWFDCEMNNIFFI